jgi:flagella basal body P-ring formation protein FlgA
MNVRRQVFTSFFLSVSLLCAAASEASELRVQLPPVIEAREGWFYLGEYANIEGDRETADSVSMAVISHAGSFSRDDVIDALAHTAAAGKSASLAMPETVLVKPESDAASELRAMTAWKWRVDVDVIPDSWDETMKGFSGYSFPAKITPGARTIAVKLYDANGKQFTKQIKVNWYQPVVYSASPLAKKTPIDIPSLRTRIGLTGMTATLFSSPEQLAGAVTRKPVSARAAISTGDISQNGFVRAGSSVTMVANVNGLGVQVKGIAMQRGGIGDMIKVKNLSSGKILKARVVGADRVEIGP